MSIVIGLVIALPVGIYSAIRQDTAADYVGRSFAILGLATPNFWLALIVIIYPAREYCRSLLSSELPAAWSARESSEGR